VCECVRYACVCERERVGVVCAVSYSSGMYVYMYIHTSPYNTHTATSQRVDGDSNRM